jgi:hypothetical protein
MCVMQAVWVINSFVRKSSMLIRDAEWICIWKVELNALVVIKLVFYLTVNNQK